MKVHFIAIGGSAMHNLALALRAKGFEVTGSDDEIFEPSKTRLANAGILPSAVGWFPEKIGSNLDAVILGMHARNDNPELVKARELGLKIFSYPEYLYEQTRDKVRAVVGGSHGKTTITSMVMHVLKASGKKFDYMVGSQVEGFDTMVGLSNEAPVAIFEGDEYLTSPIDLRPKFHLYNASIGLISGIAWDHVNVFPTFDGYVEQFRIFAENIEPSGTLIYCEDDKVVCEMVESSNIRAKKVGYKSHPHHKQGEKWVLETSYGAVVVMVFGNHNMQNIAGAKEICTRLGVSEMEFYDAILSFGGAAKRLQLLGADKLVTYYLDFAHSPSKVQATVEAVKEQFPHHNLVAALELHTFSSLSASFLSHYKGTMEEADKAVVFFNPEAILHKNLPTLTTADVKNSFGRDDLTVFSDSQKLKAAIFRQYSSKTVVLLMSSGNFGGLDLPDLVSKALEK
ncbi:MAG TPA: Mur ligase family protein [Williamwhitmania sp.]|nr:Mur ligase family protein [Williamwhitmania sp.]